MRIDDEKLENVLLDTGLISRADIDKANEIAKEKGVRFTDELLNEGKINEDDLARMEAYVLGIPFVDLKTENINFDVLSIIPEPIARNHNIVAFKHGTDFLEVAMVDPQDLEAIEFIKKKTGLRILPRLTDRESINKVLLQYQKSLKAEFGDIIAKEAPSLKTIQSAEGEEEDPEELEKLAQDLPVVRIVDTLLNHAILQQASDIHIEPLERELLIRYRIDGILHDAMILPKNAGPGITARIKVLSNLRLDEKRLPQDGRFKIETGGTKVSFRVSTLPAFFGEKTVMRLLPDNSRGYTLEGLGFYGLGLERVQKAIKKTTGMVLVTGPTGSGKTTTLYTIIELLNKPDVNISTIEDPIEYQMARINQTQVKPEIGYSFASGLRSLLRQDPDILMVGEIRDKETAQLAINAALTGHLVLSTLHTNSASGTMPRLVDMGAETFLLTSTIKLIVGQRLVRRLCNTRDEYNLKDSEVKDIEKNVNVPRIMDVLREEGVISKKITNIGSVPFYKPKKSNQSEDGYSGRLGIHEILELTPSISELISKGANSDTIEIQARKEGMLTMIEDGVVKAAKGLTSLEEVFRVANS